MRRTRTARLAGRKCRDRNGQTLRPGEEFELHPGSRLVRCYPSHCMANFAISCHRQCEGHANSLQTRLLRHPRITLGREERARARDVADADSPTLDFASGVLRRGFKEVARVQHVPGKSGCGVKKLQGVWYP